MSTNKFEKALKDLFIGLTVNFFRDYENRICKEDCQLLLSVPNNSYELKFNVKEDDFVDDSKEKTLQVEFATLARFSNMETLNIFDDTLCFWLSVTDNDPESLIVGYSGVVVTSEELIQAGLNPMELIEFCDNL